MISEKLLRKWRMDALRMTQLRKRELELASKSPRGNIDKGNIEDDIESQRRILVMTQEMLDIYLLKKASEAGKGR